MGSHFMKIHPMHLGTVAEIIGSNDPSLLRSLCETSGATRGDADRLAMAELIGGRFTSSDHHLGEHPNAPTLIRALDRLCEYTSQPAPAIEMYDDDERSPLLWEFIWRGGNPLGLPRSPHGVPAMTWHEPSETARYAMRFTDLKSSGTWNRECLSDAELDEIIRLVRQAKTANLGVFVFVEY